MGVQVERLVFDIVTNSGQSNTAARGLTRNLKKLGIASVAAKASVAALGVGTAVAVKAFADLERQIAEIRTLNPANTIDEIGGAIQRMNAQFGGGTASQAKALYDAVSAGATDAADAQQILTAANKLATAGVSDVASTMKILNAIINGFGLEAKDAAAISDSLFATVKVGITTIPELADKLGAVVPIAAAAGLSFEEMNAAVAAVTKSMGGRTDKAVIAVRQALVQILKPSKQASELAMSLGIGFDAASLRAKGLVGVLQDVARATGRDAELLNVLFGNVRALTGATALMANEFEAVNWALDEQEEKAGATNEAYNIVFNTLSEQTKIAAGGLSVLLERFGSAATKALGLVEAVKSLNSGLKSLVKETNTDTADQSSLFGFLSFLNDPDTNAEAVQAKVQELMKARGGFGAPGASAYAMGNALADVYFDGLEAKAKPRAEILEEELQSLMKSGILGGDVPDFRGFGDGSAQSGGLAPIDTPLTDRAALKAKQDALKLDQDRLKKLLKWRREQAAANEMQKRARRMIDDETAHAFLDRQARTPEELKLQQEINRQMKERLRIQGEIAILDGKIIEGKRAIRAANAIINDELALKAEDAEREIRIKQIDLETEALHRQADQWRFTTGLVTDYFRIFRDGEVTVGEVMNAVSNTIMDITNRMVQMQLQAHFQRLAHAKAEATANSAVAATAAGSAAAPMLGPAAPFLIPILVAGVLTAIQAAIAGSFATGGALGRHGATNARLAVMGDGEVVVPTAQTKGNRRSRVSMAGGGGTNIYLTSSVPVTATQWAKALTPTAGKLQRMSRSRQIRLDGRNKVRSVT